MKFIPIMIVIGLSVLTQNVNAYGSSSSKKACKKPDFSQFNPPHLAKVLPQSEFSLQVSGKTSPESIKVTVKKEPVDIEINQQSSKFIVTGKLPASLKNTHARINVTAKGTNRCKGSSGWLVNILDEPK
jgi:hypothetical protein